MSTTTTDPIEAALSLLAEFQEREQTPCVWVFGRFAFGQIEARAAAMGHLQHVIRGAPTFMGLPYKVRSEGGIELLNPAEAIAQRVFVP